VTLTVWLVWAFAAGVLGTLVWRQIRKSGSGPRSTSPSSPGPEKVLRTLKRKSGLNSDILREGTGSGAKTSDLLTVHYNAFLTSGQKVDSSYERGRTLTFKLGAGAVIIGWDTALVGMKTGEKRKVTVPASQAYGSKGQNKVPPNATVIFEIELLKIE
jgi:FKBP-type peptidyl-prolyl cis-trans isomerase